jgi:predicted CoA-substrate-specific enzyme activase
MSEPSGLVSLSRFGQGDSSDKHTCTEATDGLLWLGVDVGSTSTNLVLIDSGREIVAYRYLRTLGDPLAAVGRGLRQLNQYLSTPYEIAGVGVTGSGRHYIGNSIGADAVIDEITAQAKAAVFLEPGVDTIFEIGGQDSKFIRLKDGAVCDFTMNKICAAGTGSFLEEQARKFGIPIDRFGPLALSAGNPLDLGERCTVFIETSIASKVSRGAELPDIASGLCYSIVRNYLHRVVGHKSLGERISFQGGVAHNQGVINAFRSVTGREIVVPRFFSVSGAFGAALLASEADVESTSFRGLEGLRSRRQGRAEADATHRRLERVASFNQRMNDLVFAGYDGSRDPDKKTVGIPRALFTFGMFPMFDAFFRHLGYNVVLSDPSSDRTIQLAQEYALAETCYPVKLILGHIAELIDQKVDYIFFPDLYTVEHPESHTRRDFGCAYMQLAFKIVNETMRLGRQGIRLLAPTIAFSLGKGFMKESFERVGAELERSAEEVHEALKLGMEAFVDFEERMEAHGKESMRSIDPNQISFAVISKIYGVVDPVLNMGIPAKLMDRGYAVVPFFDLPEGDISAEHPNMYWPFGQHILEPAKVIRDRPNLYAILLTHHGCGPDSVLQHYFAELMGDKPFLNIEIDEHASDVGITTRIEAFIESLRAHSGREQERPTEASAPTTVCPEIPSLSDAARKGRRICLPQLFPYSQLLAAVLEGEGYETEILPPTNARTLALGKQHTQTNEYVTLAALVGDILGCLDSVGSRNGRRSFVVPQTEGAEVDGQYSRFVRLVLDGLGHTDVSLVSPFIEDALDADSRLIQDLFRAILAGDLLRNWPEDGRLVVLNEVVEQARDHQLDLIELERLASDLKRTVVSMPTKRTVLAVGEPLILFNEHLSSGVFRTIESHGLRVLVAPLSECLWFTWNDLLLQRDAGTERGRKQLSALRTAWNAVSSRLPNRGPFAEDLSALTAVADSELGFYAGAFGRYRYAKTRRPPANCAGVLTFASTYENTDVALGVLLRSKSNGMPILNLTFDGNANDRTAKMLDAFLRCLGS